MKANMGGSQTETKDERVGAGAREIIERAARHQISVVHIEPGSRLALVRYRRGGELYVANKLPMNAAAKLTRHFKAQAGLDLDDTDAPQAGQFKLEFGRRTYSIEVYTVPVLHGEKVTLGLHEVAKSGMSLEELGLWGKSLSEVQQALAQPKGLVIVAGRSDNYLNLTLAALIQTLKLTSLKVAFINTSQLSLPLNIKQLSTKPAAGLSVARQLAIVKRDNFDVFGVSVIGDAAAGQIVAELATRNLVLSGVLADNTAGALTQLKHLKVAPDLTNVAIGQTFVRRLCEHCRVAYEPELIELQQLDIHFQTDKPAVMAQLHKLEQIAMESGVGEGLALGSTKHMVKKLWRTKPHGCSRCDFTGYEGEIGLLEVFKPDVIILKALHDGEPAKQIEQLAIKNGMISLKVDGLMKALRGLIDLPTLLAAATNSLKYR